MAPHRMWVDVIKYAFLRIRVRLTHSGAFTHSCAAQTEWRRSSLRTRTSDHNNSIALHASLLCIFIWVLQFVSLYKIIMHYMTRTRLSGRFYVIKGKRYLYGTSSLLCVVYLFYLTNPLHTWILFIHFFANVSWNCFYIRLFF